MPRLSALLALPPVALGAVAAVWLISGAPGPAQEDTSETGLAVRVVSVSAQDIHPVVRGWGAVRASDSWTAVAEVRGQVIWRHPDLEEGKLIDAGTAVLQIDPADYQLAIAQAEADLQVLQAEANQIVTEVENTRRVLVLEQERLRLADADLARIKDLVSQGINPQTRADDAEKAQLQARRSVTELQNALGLVPPREARIAAQKARTEAALARARRDLDHTTITVPFDLRITKVAVDMFQPVGVGQVLTQGNGLERAEVVVQVPLPAFRRLLFPLDPPENMLGTMHDGPSSQISARLHPLLDPQQIWQAEVSRIEGALDPRARSVPVVVTVARPYADAAPPLRLPLVPNLEVEVALTGAVLPAAIVIPEAALHGDTVYLVSADDRLELRQVWVAFRQDGAAVIREGLALGERLVIDDIAPALPGMRLRPVEVGP
jgi:multidrug efflux pump subunit AcrA (membrane-fusion protein)